MKNQPLACDPQRIELYLRQQLSDDEQTAFELHLDDCQQCRRQLESTAANDDIWKGVLDSLQSEPSVAADASAMNVTGSESVATSDSFGHQTVLKLLAPSDDERTLGRLGTYEVIGVVGSGGMGVVLKALDAALNRYVAIKVLAPHLGSSGAARKRFSREAQAAAAVVHDNVMEIYSVADAAGLPYLVMPYVRGPSLQRRLDQDGPLGLVEVLRIGRQAAAGLAAAHAQGLVHRDVKPANMLLADGVERVKLTDFGLARAADDASVTRTGIIAGTPQYMSPEQARGESVDRRSDLFSLGSVLYAACTGRAPFRAETSYGVLRRVIDEQPRPIRDINPDIPEWLCRIISRLTSKRPEDRYGSADEVAELLEQCLAHVQQPTTVPLPASIAPSSSASRWLVGPRRWLAAAALITAMVLGMFAWQATEAPDIAGQWTGDEWGSVLLEAREPGKYEGRYGEDANAGTLQLEWSRLERRFNGTWSQGARRSGGISLRRVGDEIRGAWTTNEPAESSVENPRLADLLWRRPPAPVAADASKGIRVTLLLKADAHSHEMMQKNIGFDGISIHAAGLQGTINGKKADNLVAVLAHKCQLLSFQSTEKESETYWQAQLFVPQDATSDGSNRSLSQQRIDELFAQGVTFHLDHVRDQPAQTVAMTPKQLRQFNNVAVGSDVTVACSHNGRLIAVANGGPALIDGDDWIKVQDNWKPTVNIFHTVTGEVVVLNLTTAEELAMLATTPRISHIEATALAFSPDASLLAVGTNIGQLKLYDVRTGGLQRIFDDEPSRLADTDTPETWKPLKRAMGSVKALDFSPDGTIIATCGGSFADYAETFSDLLRLGFRGSGPGRLKLWDVQAGTLKHDLVGHNDHAYAVAFSPDGSMLASAGRWTNDGEMFGNGVLIWDPRNGRQIHRLIRTTANAGTRSIAFSPDSKQLVLGTQQFDDDTSIGGISLVNAANGNVHWMVTVPGWSKPVAFTRDGAHIVVMNGRRSIRILNKESGYTIHEINPSDPDVLWKEFSLVPENDVLVISGVNNQKQAGIEVWSLTGQQENSAPAAAATSSRDTPPNAPQDQPELIRNFSTDFGVKTVACAENGELIAVANGNPTLVLQQDGSSRVKEDWKPTVEIRDLKTGERVVALQLSTPEEDEIIAATPRVSHVEVTALALSPDANLAAVGTSIGQVKLFNARSGELVRALDHEIARRADEKAPENWQSLPRAMGRINALAFSPDGSLLSVCGESFADFSDVFDGARQLGRKVSGPGRLHIWEVESGLLQWNLPAHSHVWDAKFSRDGEVLASAGNWSNNDRDGTGVILWNARSGQTVRKFVLQANGGAHQVRYSPDGKRIVMGARVFEPDNPEDKGATLITMANATSGLVLWQRKFSGAVQPVFFQADVSLVLLQDGAFTFINEQSGETITIIGPQQGATWVDLVAAKGGYIMVAGGVDSEGKGTVSVWDFVPQVP